VAKKKRTKKAPARKPKGVWVEERTHPLVMLDDRIAQCASIIDRSLEVAEKLARIQHRALEQDKARHEDHEKRLRAMADVLCEVRTRLDKLESVVVDTDVPWIMDDQGLLHLKTVAQARDGKVDMPALNRDRQEKRGEEAAEIQRLLDVVGVRVEMATIDMWDNIQRDEVRLWAEALTKDSDSNEIQLQRPRFLPPRVHGGA
jgi:hypothetical protein